MMPHVSVIYFNGGYFTVLCALLTLTSTLANPVSNVSHEYVDLSFRDSQNDVPTLEAGTPREGSSSLRLPAPESRSSFSTGSERTKRQPAPQPSNLRSSNIFIRNNWEVVPLQVKMAHARRDAASPRSRDALHSFYPNFYLGSIQENSSTKRSPEPSSSDTGLTLSIMSPLDVLREKMLLSMANRRLHMKNKISSDNDAFLRKYG